MIDKPGIYELTDDEYHNDPCNPASASCSILQLIDTQSPLHALWTHRKLHPRIREQDEKKFDIGAVVHVLMTGKGRKIVPVEMKDWRTNEAKAQRAAILARGGLPIIGHAYDAAKRISEAAKYALESHEGRYNSATTGAERSFIWQEGEFWFRCKPDLDDVSADLMFDFKATETSAAPESFQRHIYNMGYDFRAAFYARGYEAVTGRPLKEYRFIACEVEEPHALSVFSLTPEAMDFAAKKVDRAIGIWKECLSKNDWPSYPKKVVYVTPPKWVENAQIEREITEV